MIEIESSLKITDRDIELLRFLNEQYFMVSGQIYDTFWPESGVRSGTARQRLTKLVESGYVKIVEIEKDHKKLRLFLITLKGITLLRQKKLDHGFSEVMEIGSMPVEHTLKLVNVRCLFRKLSQHRFRCERVIRKEDIERGWFPDAVLDLHGFKIAIELENTFRSKERYLERFKRYEIDKEFGLVIFVVSWPRVLGWLLDIDVPQDKICFVPYDELIQRKEEAELFNKTSKIVLKSLLS